VPGRLLRSALFIVLPGVLIVAAIATIHTRSDRDRERARAKSLEASLRQLRTQLETTNQIVGSLQREVDSGNKLIDGLRGQIDWDKSHLLDCWTAIARGVPMDSIPVSLPSLVGAARSGGTLGHFITSCASDAVP